MAVSKRSNQIREVSLLTLELVIQAVYLGYISQQTFVLEVGILSLNFMSEECNPVTLTPTKESFYISTAHKSQISDLRSQPRSGTHCSPEACRATGFTLDDDGLDVLSKKNKEIHNRFLFSFLFYFFQKRPQNFVLIIKIILLSKSKRKNL